MEILDGSVSRIEPAGITVFIPAGNYSLDKACLQKWDKVQVGLPDGRTISPEQRKKAHAILHDITEWQEGYCTTTIMERVKRQFKLDFVVYGMVALEKKMFSLKDCDMTVARDFITYLVDFAIEWAVPCKEPLWQNCEDIAKYVYACLMHKTCAVCGKDHADLHHAEDRVGMGGNRKTMIHEGMHVMPLCRIHHTECHNIEQAAFNERYHMHGIPATKEICKKWGLKYECD
jgi:hypothetical protein